MCLRSTGILKPSAPSLPKLSLSSLAQIQPAPTTPVLPKIDPGSPKVEPDSSSKRQENTSSSKTHKCPVTVAAGSSTSLERSNEQDNDMDHKWYDKDKGHA